LLENFYEKFGQIELSEEEDKVMWALKKDGVFSIKSLYRYLS
jgi:hypothetical protein